MEPGSTCTVTPFPTPVLGGSPERSVPVGSAAGPLICLGWAAATCCLPGHPLAILRFRALSGAPHEAQMLEQEHTYTRIEKKRKIHTD